MNNYFNAGEMNMPNNFNSMYPGSFNNFNNMNNNVSSQNNYGSNSDIKLINKLKKQAGNNMTFNMCGYSGETDPNKLYDVYNGFIRGNMFPELYNKYKLSRPYDIKPMNDQAELLTKVDAYCFAAHDANLYLDTHPFDRDMISFFKELSDDLNKTIKEYESKYGPLFVDSSETYPWAWNESPWPWENY